MKEQNHVFVSKEELSDPEVWESTEAFKDDIQAFKLAIEMVSDIKVKQIIRSEVVSIGARYTFLAIPEDAKENRRLIDIISLKYKTGSVSVFY